LRKLIIPGEEEEGVGILDIGRRTRGKQRERKLKKKGRQDETALLPSSTL